MALETTTKLATFTIGASNGTNSIIFSNIPQHYTDLIIYASLRGTSNDGTNYEAIGLVFNNTYANYSTIGGQGTGSSSGSYTETAYRTIGIAPNGGNTANTFGNVVIYIPNYTSSNFKSVYSESAQENNATAAYTSVHSYLNKTTAPVTQITLDSSRTGANWAQYSSVTLYGVKSMRQAMPLTGWASGGTITTDGTYIYHTFTQSNMFVANNSLKNVEVLSVAGGGGSGGQNAGGGGGGGGVLYFNVGYLDAGPYSTVVGSGGSGGYYYTSGSQGSNSFFGSLTASIGGGAGGGGWGTTPLAGGSGGSGGGGGGSTTGTQYAGGSGTSGQGNAGGSGGYNAVVNYTTGGGGGGASAAGSSGGNGAVSSPGNGGNGTSSYSTWGSATSTGQNVSSTYYYGGGGGGGAWNGPANYTTGGYGGGAAGNNGSGTPGTISTGGGASGAGTASATAVGAAGGSGVVIVRYKA